VDLSFIFGLQSDDSGMAETENFKIKYDGEALAEHSIDVNDLAPALLSLADLIQEANAIANKDKSTISIRVKATETGCFQISIQAVKAVYDTTANLLAGRDVTALANLLGIVGFFGVSGGLIVLIKKLAAKKPKSIVPKGQNEIEIEVEPGLFVIITKMEWEMYQSKKIRESIYGLLKPLEKPGVNSVEFIDEHHNSNKVTKGELAYFIPPKESIEPLQELPPRETYVNIVQMWFKDGNKWKFSEGENEWYAEIKDQAFIEKLLKGETFIRANDLFKVKVKQVQYREGSVVKSTYEIIEVLEHAHAPQQSSLL
jgi:hypothetical protein